MKYDREDEDDVHYYSTLYENDFVPRVEKFGMYDPIWSQRDYEVRINTEAELMISLEALRAALINLEGDVYDLEYCHGEFEHNYGHIMDNLWNASQPWMEELRLQQKRIAYLGR